MQNKVALKGVKIADKVLQAAMDITFVIVLLIGIYYIVDTVYVFNNAKASSVGAYKPEHPEEIAALQKVAHDAIAWITIDGSDVDYPIMQGKDNIEYLNKDPYGAYSLAGSIFLDSRNSSDFSDPYSVVYGHHMSGGYMFGALDVFEGKQYFEEHPTGKLVTSRGEFRVTVIAFLYTDAHNEEIFDPEIDHSGLKAFVEAEALHMRPMDDSKRIVALTTCKSPTSTRRMVLILTMDE